MINDIIFTLSNQIALIKQGLLINKKLSKMNTTTTNQPELLVNDSAGIYVINQFCKVYAAYITNMDKVKEDFDICLSGPDHEDYHEAWANLLDNVEFTNDMGEKYTIGNLGEGGDLWAIPDGYEYPDEY